MMTYQNLHGRRTIAECRHLSPHGISADSTPLREKVRYIVNTYAKIIKNNAYQILQQLFAVDPNQGQQSIIHWVIFAKEVVR